ncbi:MAG: hypothetical protein QM756_15325 [Polyangiaceae bacterium]
MLLAVSLASRSVKAESALVVLVRPPVQSPFVVEAITRIQGELTADGFEVMVVQESASEAHVSVLSRADPNRSATAALGLFVNADAKSAELWVVDRLTSKTVVRSIDIDVGSAPELLARRSVELLRASLLEILVDSEDQASSSGHASAGAAGRAQAAHWVAQSLEPHTSRWAIEAGAQLLSGVGGFGVAAMPIVRGRFAVDRLFSLRLSLSGLGTRPRFETAQSQATLSQGLGLLELIVELGGHARLRPLASLGAGAYYVGVEGRASSPYVGLEDDRFVFATDAGVGLAVEVNSFLEVSLDAHTTLVSPYPVIRFFQEDAAKVGNPLLSGTLTLVGRL